MHVLRHSGDEILEGVLMCQGGPVHFFPIFRGVPSLIAEVPFPREWRRVYAKELQSIGVPPHENDLSRVLPDDFTFSHQWAMHRYDDVTWELDLDQRLDLFQRYTGLSLPHEGNVRVLDAGCGNGTLSAALAECGLEVIAMDYSNGVVQAFENVFMGRMTFRHAHGRLHYIQGDLQRPPFKNDTFDLIYSDGVLHHTSDTATSFRALISSLRQGGSFFVWLYRADTSGTEYFKSRAVHGVRALTRQWSTRNKIRLCRLGAHVIIGLTYIRRAIGDKSRRLIPVDLKTVNLFDTISPTYNHEHTESEVMQWYEEAGFEGIRVVSISDYRLNRGGFAMIGSKR
jgi:SAM-dependent methyltransferase